MTTLTEAPTDPMLRIFSILLWTAVFLLMVLAVDQLLLRVPASLPAHAAVATFYRELRSRMLDLATGELALPVKPAGVPVKPGAPTKGREASPRPPADIEAVIEQRREKRPVSTPPPAQPPAVRPAPPLIKPVAAAEPPSSIEAVIDQRAPKPAAAAVKVSPVTTRPAPAEPVRRYLYADEQGNLHFAETLAEVPEQYRDKARLVRE